MSGLSFILAGMLAAASESKARWEYPRCAVRLDATAVALVAGYPDSDGEDLAEVTQSIDGVEQSTDIDKTGTFRIQISSTCRWKFSVAAR